MSAFWTFVTQDWYFFWPMFLMSLTGITLVIWRLLLNINGSTNMSEFLPAFQQRLEKEGVEGACATAGRAPTSFPADCSLLAWKYRSRVWPPCADQWPT